MMIDGNSVISQQQRLLQRLRQGSLSTLEARQELDILMPAARVHELRHQQNFNIVTHWEDGKTVKGKMHRVARYVLLPGKFKHEVTGGKHV